MFRVTTSIIVLLLTYSSFGEVQKVILKKADKKSFCLTIPDAIKLSKYALKKYKDSNDTKIIYEEEDFVKAHLASNKYLSRIIHLQAVQDEKDKKKISLIVSTEVSDSFTKISPRFAFDLSTFFDHFRSFYNRWPSKTCK